MATIFQAIGIIAVGCVAAVFIGIFAAAIQARFTYRGWRRGRRPLI